MVVVNSTLIPTLAEAERAAKVVADAGAGRVLLFGSVATGDAHRHSDIDLMVIYDDLDYAVRQDLTMELERLAGSEVGCSVDVHLTDRPEWRMRTEQVVTSFESRVKCHALVMVDEPAGQVDWGKEIDELFPQLLETHRSEIKTRLAAVGVKNLQSWQQQALYQRSVTPTPEAFTAITEAACGVALYAADQFKPGLDIATDVRSKVSVIEQAITHLDLYTGRDRSGDAAEGRGPSFDL